MTIAAAYLVSEGVVFGADSSTTVSFRASDGGGGVLQLLNHAQKVFEVGSNSRIGVCTWGAGALGGTSHRTVIARLADMINEGSTIREAAETLCALATPLVRSSGVDFVGYYLGGWDPPTHEPACFQIDVRPAETKMSPIPLGTCAFSGMPQFFTRIFRGYDPLLPEMLRRELRASLGEAVSSIPFDQLFDQAFATATNPLVAAGFKDLPIREAIDFVHSYLHITIKAIKYKFGAPACGGPIEVAFISTDRRYRWVRHKRFSSAIEEGEVDHETL